jgi:hypothetical protein
MAYPAFRKCSHKQRNLGCRASITRRAGARRLKGGGSLQEPAKRKEGSPKMTKKEVVLEPREKKEDRKEVRNLKGEVSSIHASATRIKIAEIWWGGIMEGC